MNVKILILKKLLKMRSISFTACHVEKTCFATHTKDIQKHQNYLLLPRSVVVALISIELKLSPSAEAYLEASRKSTMELFWKNS